MQTKCASAPSESGHRKFFHKTSVQPMPLSYFPCPDKVVGAETQKIMHEKFFTCCENGDREGVLALLPHIDPNIRHTEETPVIYIYGGVTFTGSNIGGQTALHFVCEKNQKDIAHILIEHGAHVTAQDEEGQTPLHYAIEEENLDIVKLLSQYPEALDVKDHSGDTPLLTACNYRSFGSIQVLVEAGANLYLKNNQNKNAFDILSENCFYEALSYLQKYSLSHLKEQILAQNESEFERHQKSFHGQKNLLEFHKDFTVKLEELFLAHKVLASGLIPPIPGQLSTIGSYISIFSGAIALIPLLGPHISGAMQGFAAGCHQIDRMRQQNTAIRSSSFFTISEIQESAERLAWRLTKNYETPIMCLARPEEIKLTKTQKKLFQARKKIIYCDYTLPPTKRLVAYGLLIIMEAFQHIDEHGITTIEELENFLFNSIANQKTPHKVIKTWEKIISKIPFQNKKISLEEGCEKWKVETVYHLPHSESKGIL